MRRGAQAERAAGGGKMGEEADVVAMSCGVENDKIVEYRATVNIAFGVER